MGNANEDRSKLPIPATPDDGAGAIERERVRKQAQERLFGVASEPVTLGRFEVVDRIGAGAMGVVYKARDPNLERWVAVKLLADGGSGSPHRRARMVREAKAMARLSHPNVVVVHEVGEHDGQVFIAMEYVDGANLREWLEQERPTVGEVLRALGSVGRGIDAAHRRGLVHRDVKPENVLLDREGRARIADFGVVRTEDSGSGDDVPADAPTAGFIEGAMTRTGALIGTPAYMAPEQLHGRSADPRSDQFSFCTMLFEALYGVRPFIGDNVAQLLWALTTGKMSTPAEEVDLPAGIHQILKRGLSIDPDERYPSLGELLDALEQAQGAAPGPASATMAADERPVAAAATDLGTAATVATGDEPPAAMPAPSTITAVTADALPAEAPTPAQETTASPAGPSRRVMLFGAAALIAVAAGALALGRWSQSAEPEQDGPAVATADADEADRASEEGSTVGTGESDAPEASAEEGRESADPTVASRDDARSPGAPEPPPAAVPTGHATAPSGPNRCSGLQGCTRNGLCTPRGDRCVVGSDADCRRSTGCKTWGACSKVGDTDCGAKTDADCRSSAGCASQGKCTAKRHSCLAWEHADCEAAAICRTHGKCSANANCEARSAVKCRASARCRSHGECSLGSGTSCVAASDADCQGSTRCQGQGDCKARNGRCGP